MFYVIENSYVGVNPDQNIDSDHIDISLSPALCNGSKKPMISGWCGSTGAWSIFAHGEYATIESARDAIAEKFGAVREAENDFDPDVIESYKLGEFIPMGRQHTADWAYQALVTDITADSTDSDMADLAEELESVANGDGYTLRDIAGIIDEYRANLREDQ